jgi:hypothetical protein
MYTGVPYFCRKAKLPKSQEQIGSAPGVVLKLRTLGAQMTELSLEYKNLLSIWGLTGLTELDL